MKDIDFDELDKAVSSLMGSVPKGNSAQSASVSNSPQEPSLTSGNEPKEKIITIGQDIQNTPITSSNAASEPAPSEKKAATEDQVQQGVQSRGRFMDMVRPSSREGRKPFPSSSVSRQGVTLQPAASTRIATVIKETSEEVPTEDNATALPDLSVAMQDIIGFEDTSVSSDTEAATVTTPTMTEEAETEAAMDDTPPLTSPFLPDAKVEKRPLGRAPELVPAVDLESELQQEMDSVPEPFSAPDSSVSLDRDAQLPEQPLPAELGSELLSIETSTTSAFPQENTPPLVQENVPQPQSAAVAPEVPVTAIPQQPSSQYVSPASPSMQSMAAASIPQQYKVQPETTDETPIGGIYDAQPLTHPAKGKPGWLFVVIIILILVLGAAGGAAVYYLGLL